MTIETTLNTFTAEKAGIKAMLARLTTLADNDFNIDPYNIKEADVNILNVYANELKAISEGAFRDKGFTF